MVHAQSLLRRAAASAVALAMVLVLVPFAQGLPDDVPDDTWGTDGSVNAILQVGNVVFLGGNFTEVREDGGAGPGVLARAHVAAFDASTGAPIDGWDPSSTARCTRWRRPRTEAGSMPVVCS